MYQDAGTTGSVQTLDPILGPPPPSSPSRLTRRGRVLYLAATAVMILALATATWYLLDRVADPVMLAYWWLGTGILLSCAHVLLARRRTPDGPVPAGRIVAIVPVHEPEAADLNACIWSILDQRGVAVDEVHVVDDGSTKRPVVPFGHHRVRWHRMPRGGRRAAQLYALDRLDATDWDFVLTVDGDHVLDPRAVHHQLRALARPRVTATTTSVIVRNARQNLLTRIADVQIGTSGATRWAGWSSPAALKIISGAPAVYGAGLVFQHKRRSVTAADHGEEVDLAMFAADEGVVAGVPEAIAWTRTPATARTAFRQRSRWAASWWHMIALTTTGTVRPRGIVLRLAVVIRLVLGPLAIGYALFAAAVGLGRGTLTWPSIALFTAQYLLVRYALTALYLIERPRTGRRRKIWTWLLLTPAATLGNLLFVVPVKCVALLEVGWRKMADRHDGPATGLDAASVAEPGTVYISDQLPEEDAT